MASDAFYQAYVEIVPEAKNLRKQLASEFDAAGPEAGRRAGDGVNKGVLGAVGKLAAPLAAAFAAVGIGSIIKDSIDNASDFQEAGTAIEAVFGDASATIQSFAAGSAASLGQATNMTLDAARVFGTFGKAAGLGGEELAGFSTDFITLAADLASFNNTTPEQAIEALGAGLRGESEPLRQYGVLLDDAALKARATELGIYSGTGALTQQQKVLAAQAEIMAQTNLQQGDFAKTSGGLANQQRILSAGLANLSTSFGALLLPIMTTVVGFLNTSVIPALQAVLPAVGAIKSILVDGDFSGAIGDALGVEEDSPLVAFLFGLRDAFGGFFAFVGPILDQIGAAFGPVFEQLQPVFAALIPQLIDLWTNFSPLAIIFQAIQPLLPELLGMFATLASTLGGVLGQALTTLLPVITQLSGTLAGVLGGVIAAILPVIMQLVGILGPILTTVINALLPVVTILAQVIGAVFEAVVPLLEPILALIAPLVELVGAILGPLVELFAALLVPILALIEPIIGLLVPVIQFLVEVLAAVIQGIVSVITWLVDLVTGSGDARDQLMAVFGAIGDFFGTFFEDTIGMFVDFFNNTVGMFVDFGANIIQGLIDGITGAVSGVGDAIGGVMDFIGGFFPHSPAKRGPFSGSGWSNLKKSGADLMGQFTDGMQGPELALGVSSSLNVAALRPRIDPTVYQGGTQTPAGAERVQNFYGFEKQTASEIAQISENADRRAKRKVR